MSILRAVTFKDSEATFTVVLDAHGIRYNKRYPPIGTIIASGIPIEIIVGGEVWGALAVACLAWASVKKSRRINVTTRDGKSARLEGYSADDAAKILEAAEHIVVIDTKPGE